MLWEIRALVKEVLLPPVGLGWFLVVAWWQFYKRPRLSRSLIALAILGGCCLAIPLTSQTLLRQVTINGDAAAYPRAQAIVILSAERSLVWDVAHKEVLDANPGELTLQRLRIGARLAKQTGLPILVTGGKDDHDPTLAEVMRRVLQEDFGASVRWIEDKSHNTAENAHFSARILLPQKIRTVILVTSGFHMRRAIALFNQAGFDVLPAPVPPVGPAGSQGPLEWRDFLPNAKSLMGSYYAFHELGGLAVSMLSAKLNPSTAVGN